MRLVYRCMLPELGGPNVVSRELKLVADDEVQFLPVGISSRIFDLPPVKEGASVTLSVRDTDDEGNVSEWSDESSFTARGYFPPKKPGCVNVKLIGEVEDVKPEPDFVYVPDPKPFYVPEPEVVIGPEPDPPEEPE